MRGSSHEAPMSAPESPTLVKRKAIFALRAAIRTSQAEAMLHVAERLSDKIDRVSVMVDEGYGNDVQIVVDRMSEAIQAMSGRTQRRDQGQIGA